MSINLATSLKVVPYLGGITSTPVSYCGRKTTIVPIDIDWQGYWVSAGNPVNLGISLNLNAGQVASVSGVLSSIQSVKIDNTNSTVPIYVQFPDTRDTITCPPQTVVTLPVFTGQQQAIIAAQGLVAGSIPQTRIFFSDAPVFPSIDPAIQISYPLWKGSTTIQRTNSLLPGFGSPSLGDQAANKECGFSGADGTDKVILPVSTGFNYLTSISIFTASFKMTFGAATSVGQWRGFFGDLTTGQELIGIDLIADTELNPIAPNLTYYGVVNAPLFGQGGFQTRVDGTHSYGIRQSAVTPISGGGISSFTVRLQVFIGFTNNPA